jgi:hypothetical protein
MKNVRVFLAIAFAITAAFAQSDRGIITGTVSDTTGAIVPAAKVVLTNNETAAAYETVTTSTGNYTLPALPVGNYKLSIEHPGFSKSERTNISVQVAVTTRVDLVLQVGTATQSIDVGAESTLLKTESAEQSTTITGAQLNALPINFGIGAGAIRNPLSFTQMTPGATINGWNNITVNGTNGGYRILFEGQESSSALDARVSDESQPSVEAIQEFTLQTSNFAPEFGIVSGGLYNFTSRSGTNQFHGSGYIYIQNTAFNAGLPFTDNGRGGHVQIVKHLADGGFSVGGPVYVPKVYDGRNRTFFFFNWERYRDREALYNGITTVPNTAFRNGDLSAIIGRNLGTDFAGRAILQNAIYDPASTTIDSSGRRVLNVFPNNVIPQNLFDPVSVKIMGLLPKPNISDTLVNNFAASGAFYKIQAIPSIKIDHSFNTKAKISGYYSEEHTTKSNGVDGLAEPISQVRIQDIHSKTFRVNYDHSITPTLLLHLGAGVQRYHNPDTVPEESSGYDNKLLGIINAPGTGFPRFGGGTLGGNTYGGMALPIGPGNRGLYLDLKPTGVAQMTWVHGNHTYKAGGEWKIDSFINISDIGLSPAYGFSGSQTGQPLYGQALPSGTGIGYNWASFLLGGYDSASIGDSVNPQYRRAAWGFYVQDTWKVNRKLTLDYGLRYDLQLPSRELWRRTSGFNRDLPNPNANGRPGAVLYEGEGAGRCGCNLVATYPYAIAPRLGAAYQIDSKTVLRAGWGLSYASVAQFSYIGGGNSQGMGFNTISFPSPGNGVAAGKISQPLVYDNNALYGASYNPGLLVSPGGTIQSAPATVDPNGGRPPRINQWNVSLQREIFRDLVVEASYIGNKGAWLQAGGNLINYNAYSPAYLQSLGLDITNPTTRTLLTSTITSPVAVAAGFKKPYANFPDSGTVVQSLKPFPQYNGIGSLWAPLGDSWYNAFQAKLTKRFSSGLSALVAFSHSKTLDSFSGNGNLYDRGTFKSLSPNDRPNILSVSIDYTTQPYGFLKTNRIARSVLAGWTVGVIATYQSGPLLGAPGSTNSLGTYLPGQATRQFRVSNVPLFLKDLNCGCIDPTQETVLNPAAWQDQPTGVFGTGTVYYNDFRGQRRPVESFSLGKRFPIRERMSLSIRGEFFNPLNRMEAVSDPSTGSPSNPPTRANGLLTGGFGYMNYTAISSNVVGGTLPAPRTGQIVARFEF